MIKPVDCQACHETAGYQNSVHGGGAGSEAAKAPAEGPAACKDCHGTHAVISPKEAKSSANRGHISQSCGKCHEEVALHYQRSAHGTALRQGV